MIEREIVPRLRRLFEQYPIVTVTGPRQSGKTTLSKETFPSLSYVNLEAPDTREFAESDPRGFLSQLGEPAIIDEIQRVPQLLSYLQQIVDEHGGNSLYILTGSEQFALSEGISQSLAGRTALLHLLPFSLAERRQIGATIEIDEVLFSGFYPRILDRDLEPRQAHADYFETYIERDVRRLGGVRNLSSFGRFVRLCAGRVGQIVNLSALGSDVGVSHATAREWLTILERSYIVFQLPPFFSNIGKRLVKSPKLYFYDVGLASYLIGIERADQLATHPLRGQLFENLVAAEAIKHRFNQGRESNLSFFRDAKGLECDLFYETGDGFAAIEIKSGATVSSDYVTAPNRVAEQVKQVTSKSVVYGGKARQSRTDTEVVPLADFTGLLKRLDVDQELTNLISDRTPLTPSPTDVETLDRVFRLQIRPILDALEDKSSSLGQALFARYRVDSRVNTGTRRVGGAAVLSAESWEDTKSDYIVGNRFDLNNERPVELQHVIKFREYVGKGVGGFSITVTLVWTLLGDHLTRSALIDNASIPALDASIPYAELEDASVDVNLVVAEVLAGVIDRISVRSAAKTND